MATRARHGIFKPKRIAKHEHRHYLPYLPLMAVALSLLVLNVLQPIKKFGVLAYATEMSREQLLASTNSRRSQNGAKTLALNSKLNSAAQAKANDMVKRDYWSHNTPDGDEPWVFISNAGYKYLKAGENLAYGFSTSDATVTGWMNSPSHKANLLDSAFLEVGFGFANSGDYNDSGPETVVVAMYGKPEVLSASGSAPAPPPPPAAQPSSTKPSTSKPKEKPEETALKLESLPINTESLLNAEPASRQIARVEGLATIAPSWAVFVTGALTGVLTAALLVKHAVGFRKFIRSSEKFVLHHPMFDLVVVSLILLGSFLLQTVGVIK